ncbi:MAG: flagellar basal body-associated FliL family protein [Candidatus Scalindua sp.]
MDNEANDNSAEKTVDAAATEDSKDVNVSEEAVNVAVVEDSKDVNVDKKVVDAIATDDFDDANAGKKRFVNASLMNTLIMVLVALISIVCSFVFVSKTFSPRDNNFEVQGVNSASNSGSIGDVPQGDTSVKREDKKSKTDKGKTNKANKASAETGNTDDTGNGKGAGGIQDAIVVSMETVVVNLGGISSNRYLRVQTSLEVDNENDQIMISEKEVILRDKMISFFSSKTMRDVETEGDLFKLRLELKDVLNGLVGSGIIKQIYFSDFIVQ